MSGESGAVVQQDETRSATIWCPGCDWTKDVEMDGPAGGVEGGEWPQAYYFAESDVRMHVGEWETFQDETHSPFIYYDNGEVKRFEPEVSEFVR